MLLFVLRFVSLFYVVKNICCASAAGRHFFMGLPVNIIWFYSGSWNSKNPKFLSHCFFLLPTNYSSALWADVVAFSVVDGAGLSVVQVILSSKGQVSETGLVLVTFKTFASSVSNVPLWSISAFPPLCMKDGAGLEGTEPQPTRSKNHRANLNYVDLWANS